MNNQEKIIAFKHWQNSKNVHPFTCIYGHTHRNLEAREIDGEVEIYCLDCEWIQEWPIEIFDKEEMKTSNFWERKISLIGKAVAC